MIGVMIISFIVLIAFVAAIDISFSFIRWKMLKSEEAMINSSLAEMEAEMFRASPANRRHSTPPPPNPRPARTTNIYQLSQYRTRKKD